jgi:hypothetical protein
MLTRRPASGEAAAFDDLTEDRQARQPIDVRSGLSALN